MEIGSVVWLKSGGPKMVVADHGLDGRIACSWHRSDGQLEHAWFVETMLTQQQPTAAPVRETEIITERDHGDWLDMMKEK